MPNKDLDGLKKLTASESWEKEESAEPTMILAFRKQHFSLTKTAYQGLIKWGTSELTLLLDFSTLGVQPHTRFAGSCGYVYEELQEYFDQQDVPNVANTKYR
ncbi:hypothetical protein GDO86_000141 [Hymenochirus boettgeri]|uniref:Uncharacterized protein n=1 Tax=Hymenochirus boettgeri TaxID=247094 RepID=A0A8T2K862_9PIPI|nr:hypothetical protein GDO86_000141 [Hymenochirus boettgeri]